MSHWLVYWVLMLDNISVGLGVVLATVAIYLFYLYCLDDDIYDKAENNYIKNPKTKKLKKLMWLLLFFIIAIVSFAPSTKQMAAIYLIPQIVSNKSIKQLPPKLSKLALEYVNKELNMETKK